MADALVSAGATLPRSTWRDSRNEVAAGLLAHRGDRAGAEQILRARANVGDWGRQVRDGGSRGSAPSAQCWRICMSPRPAHHRPWECGCGALHRLLLRPRVLDCEILKVAGQRTGPRQRQRSAGDRRPSALALVTATGELAALPRLGSPKISMASADRTRRPGLADIRWKDLYHHPHRPPGPAGRPGVADTWRSRCTTASPGSVAARRRRDFRPCSP